MIVIDDADDLNDESANCFLKTLEEPPPRSVLILVGSNPERQLPTIVSRCQVVRFAPLPGDLMRTLLEENGVSDEAVRDRLVRLGAGSPGMALCAERSGAVGVSPNLPGRADANADRCRGAGSEVDGVRREGLRVGGAARSVAQLVIRLVIDFLDDVLTVAHGGERRARTGPEDEAAVRAMADRLTPEQVLAMLERCLEACEQVERSVLLVLVLEGLLDALAALTAAPEKMKR